MTALAIIGCGFVADLYMASLAKHADLRVVRVFDKDPARLSAFAAHWSLEAADTLDGLLGGLPKGCIILNLTNPAAHFEVSQACLLAGFHVYSEKPLAMTLDQAKALHGLAAKQGVLLASAPCSVLGEAAQVLARAVREGVAGRPRLVYAELDDGFIPQAPYADWQNASGAPWPFADEFQVGCTLEHAGYYLTWLIAMFGPVRRVVAASAELLADKPGGGDAPDFSVAVLFFDGGVVARLTCSIIAPHDHSIRVIGDKGVLAVRRAWDNAAPVRFHRRLRLRRRLIDLPFGRRVRARASHPKVGRTGAAAMNFALGPAEMAAALAQARPCRLSADFALHLTEVTLAIQNSGDQAGAQAMTTTCARPEAMPWAR